MLSQKKHSDWKEQVIRMGVGNMGLKMGGGSREGGSRRPEKKSAPPPVSSIQSEGFVLA